MRISDVLEDMGKLPRQKLTLIHQSFIGLSYAAIEQPKS